ncbi:MFS transporter [Mesotoga sp. Brook.08.YT.4.2.5.1]|uniref:MFS transporter n=1 Tax=unclassified Mesotoga TaxID=1184398 RepID=UPI000C184734|nr:MULTISPECIES: MFS transporter [unclassified Mesotoga]PNE23454.1 MFS transporter [Mesotoga sp. Brook.08.YT.4.2.5.1]PVD16728.1 MFS transporter [Mesotoga sp. Brook.08.105.5.1]RAO95617.1 MFS transporter [Mesotoga sp. Brook.08.YT.4.2.5.4.]RDI92199.1 MFS transporter [Mesotoga sp. Brook.08.YT.4.2.5.2.]
MFNKRLPLLLTSLIVFFVMFGFGLLLQLKLRELGASLLMVGLLTTVRGAVETLGSPAWGAISDSLKRRKPLMIVLVLTSALLYFAYSVIEIPLVFILFSALIAFFTAGFEPIAMALSTEHSRDSVRNTSRELSILNTANSMGMLSGRLLLSMLLVFLTVTQTINWYATIAFLAVIPALFLRDQEHTVARRKGFLNRLFPLKQDSSPLWENGLWAVYVGTFLRQLGTAGATSIIAIFMTERIGLSASATAIITSVNPFMQIFSHIFFGRVMYRIGPRKSTLIGIGLTIFTMLFFAMAQSWVLIALGYFSLGIAFGAFINGAGTMISLSSPPERRAEFLGLLRSARAIGFMVGPLLAGTVAEYSYFVMFIMMASLIAAGGLIVIVFTKDRLITS